MYTYGVYGSFGFKWYICYICCLLPNAANSTQLKPESFQMLQIACKQGLTSPKCGKLHAIKA